MTTHISPELRSFLTESVRLARLSTLLKSGQPYVQPVWFQVDGDDLVFVLLRPSVLGRNVRRDPRATACVDDDQVPYAYAVMQGTFDLSDDEEATRPWMRRNIIKFRSDIKDVDAHEDRLMALGVTLARLKLHTVYFEPKVSPDYE